MTEQVATAGSTVTFRMPALALLAAPGCLGATGLELMLLAATHHSAPVGSAGIYLIFLGAGMLAINLLLRVQVSPAGVRIRGLGRNRLVGWQRIRAITVEPQRRGGRRVTLWTTSGARVRLPLPMTNKSWNEAAFLRDYHQLGQYWLANREPVEQPSADRRPGW